jgi:hypothetical protein
MTKRQKTYDETQQSPPALASIWREVQVSIAHVCTTYHGFKRYIN